MMIWVHSINLPLQLSLVGFKDVKDFLKALISHALTPCSLIGLCKTKFGPCNTKLSNTFYKELISHASTSCYPKQADACYWPPVVGISSGHMAWLAINQAGAGDAGGWVADGGRYVFVLVLV